MTTQIANDRATAIAKADEYLLGAGLPTYTELLESTKTCVDLVTKAGLSKTIHAQVVELVRIEQLIAGAIGPGAYGARRSKVHAQSDI